MNTLRAELEEEYSDLFGEQFFSSSSPTTPLAVEMATVLEIPEFHGGPEEDLSVWVETVSAIFEIAPKEDDTRYKYAVAYLRGGARALITCYAGEQKWSALKEFLRPLDPRGSQLAATVALFGLRQGDQTLDAYFKACLTLFGRFSPSMAKEEQVRWYLSGLGPAAKSHITEVSLKGTISDAHATLLAKAVPVTYNPGVSVATNVVNALEHAGRGSIRRVGPSPGGLSQIQRENLRDQNRCFRCFRHFRPGHVCGSGHLSSLPSLSLLGGSRLMFVSGLVDGQRVECLIDSGASENFLREGIIKRVVNWGDSVTLASGITQGCSAPVSAELQVQGHKGFHKFVVTQIRFDVILGLPWLAAVRPDIDWVAKTLVCPTEPTSFQVRHQSRGAQVLLDAVSMNGLLAGLQEEDGTEVFVLSIESRNQPQTAHPAAVSALLEEFAGVFPDALPLELPPDRGGSFRIVLRPETRPQVRPMKRFSVKDMECLVSEVETLLKAGLIKPSESEFGAQVLFVNKKDGTRRMCIDYRSLNADTIRDVYPLPLVDELFDRLGSAKVFSKLDLRSGYHQMLMNPADTHKTAFRTPFGNFEFLVLPFGLANAPSAFSRMIEREFPVREYGSFVAPYFDDLLVYSPDDQSHLGHLRKVLAKLQSAHLYAKPSKCVFAVKEVEYLGFLVSAEGIRSDPSKVAAIGEMPAPTDASGLKSFLGMIVYFSRFIRNHAALALVLTDLTKKGVPFVWTSDHQKAFEELKMALTKTPVLRPFDPRHEIVVQTDASDRAVGAVLLQRPPSGALRPVAFLSRKLSPAEFKYPVQEKEAAAIVYAFKKWEHYLLGAEFRLETDHQSLIHVKSSVKPSPRLTHWLDFLALFHYDPVYRPGATNCTADCLSRLVPGLNAISGPAPDPEVISKIKEGYSGDPYFAPVHKALILKQQVVAKFKTRVVQFYAADGLLFFRDATGDRTCVPKMPELRLQLMKECHEAVTAGHLGMANTHFALRRRYFWPKMESSVRRWIKGCQVCQKTKPDLRGTTGLYKPLEIPSAPWESIGVDFITALPDSGGFDSIMTVVDRFSGMAHFIPTQKSVTAQGVAELFTTNVFRLHGLPRSMVSDRDPKFTSDFWKKLFERLDVKLSMTTADHPQSNGQTERANGSITQMLRAYSFENAATWPRHLPLLEFSYNSAKNSSTSTTPFQAAYGVLPLAPADTYAPSSASPVLFDKLTQVHRFVSDSRRDAQDAVASRENVSRREFAAKPGDLVWLDTKQSRSSTVVSENNKMKELYSGPYKVLEADSNSAKLDLPERMGIHPRVNASKLKAYEPPVIPLAEPAPDPDGSYEVELILKKRRVHRGKRYVNQYLVRWKGYDSRHDEWLDAAELTSAKDRVKEFELRTTSSSQ